MVTAPGFNAPEAAKKAQEAAEAAEQQRIANEQRKKDIRKRLQDSKAERERNQDTSSGLRTMETNAWDKIKKNNQRINDQANKQTQEIAAKNKQRVAQTANSMALGPEAAVAVGAANALGAAKDKAKQAVAPVVNTGKKVVGTGLALGGAAVGFGLSKAAEAGNTGIFIFLSIFLYISDIYTRFNGVIVTDLLSFSADFWKSVFINGVVIVLAIAYGVIAKPNMREYISTIVLFWTFSFIFFLGGFYSGIFHFFFVVILYIFLIRPSTQDRAAANYTTAILLLFDFVGYGLLSYWFSTQSFATEATILANRFVLPIWFYYTLILTHEKKKNWFTGLVIFLVIGINVFYFASGITGVADKTLDLRASSVDEGMDFIGTGWGNMKSFFGNVWNRSKTAYQTGLIYATGGYYDTLVEENEGEPLGVYLEDVSSPDTKYYEDEGISYWWTLSARTLDHEKPINIALECHSEYDKDDWEEGIPYPDDFPGDPKNMEVYNLEERDVECSFKEFQLKQGDRTITMFADFNFQTISYLKRYFMDLETMRVMNREGIEILPYYKIIDQNPITRYTKGPIAISIGETSPLTGLTTARDNNLRLGFGLEQEWEGTIKQINNLTVYLPLGIDLDADLCNGEFESAGIQKLGDEEVNAYRLTDEAKNSSKRTGQEKMSFNCRMKVDSGSVDDVLGKTPITIKYFRVSADYNFKLAKSRKIEVERQEGFNARLDPLKPTSEENIRCIATHSKEKFEGVSYSFFKFGDPTPLVDNERAEKRSDRVYYSPQLPHSKTERDDIVYCTMKAKLRGEEETIDAKSVEVVIQDSPPRFKRGPTISNGTCNAIIHDEDGDEISINYELSVGGDILEQSKKSCSRLGDTEEYECSVPLSIPYEEGDTIKCSMTPFSFDTNGERKSDTWKVE